MKIVEFAKNKTFRGFDDEVNHWNKSLAPDVVVIKVDQFFLPFKSLILVNRLLQQFLQFNI